MGNNSSFQDLLSLNTKLNSTLLFPDCSLSVVGELLRSMNAAYSALLSEGVQNSRCYKPRYFTHSEFVNSVTAERLKILNDFDEGSSTDCNFRFLCRNVLDPAREQFGEPIMITSGYRSGALNKAVGGVPNSYHLIGRAADLVCSDLPKLHAILQNLPHRELILHPSYIHVAL